MKKVIALITVVCMFVVSAPIFAQPKLAVSFEGAKKRLMVENHDLKKLKYSKKQANMQYEKAVSGAKRARNNLDNYSEYFDNYTEMLLEKQEQLMPKVAENGVKMAEENIKVSRDKLITGLRDVYMGLLSAYYDMNIQNEKYELSKKKYESGKIKYESGLIDDAGFMQVEYDFLKAEKNYDASKRNYDNMLRNFNSYIGESTKPEYECVKYDEKINADINTLDYYVKNGLENRIEIKQIENEIYLKQFELKILEKEGVYKAYKDARKDYANIQRELKNLSLKYNKTKLDIEKEIRSGYVDVLEEKSKVLSLSKKVLLQKKYLEDINKQYEAGMISQIMLNEAQIGTKEIENGYNLAVFGYNTKIMKLKNAAGIEL